MFADESGNFDFSTGRGASKYFIVTTVSTGDFAPGDALLQLRRQLAWERHDQKTPDFHASEELQAVRDRVFDELSRFAFRVDTTVIEKRKVYPHIAADQVRFYKTAWYLHFKYIAPRIAKEGDELLVISASLGTKSRREAFRGAVEDVVAQVSPAADWRTVSWAAASDPCLWVADYCAWAIQRKWESGDPRSYDLIRDKIATEFDAFARSTRVYF